MNELFLSYELGLIARSAGAAASAFIDGVLRRGTSHRNHILNDSTFLDAPPSGLTGVQVTTPKPPTPGIATLT